MPNTGFGPDDRIGGEAVVATASNTRLLVDPWNAVIAVRRPLGGWDDPARFLTHESPWEILAAPDGTATMFMVDSSDREHPRAQYVTRSPSGELQGPTTVAEDRRWSGVAMNLRGDMLAASRRPEGGPIELAERTRGSHAFSPPRLSPAADAWGGSAFLALNDAGQAAIAWNGPNRRRPLVAVRDDPAVPLPPPPPTVEVAPSGTPRLDEDGHLRIAVRCSTGCKALPSGTLAPAGNAELVRFDGSSRRISAKRLTVLKLRFGRDRARSVRKALRAGRRPWVSVSVRARGKSPRPITASRRIRLR